VGPLHSTCTSTAPPRVPRKARPQNTTARPPKHADTIIVVWSISPPLPSLSTPLLLPEREARPTPAPPPAFLDSTEWRRRHATNANTKEASLMFYVFVVRCAHEEVDAAKYEHDVFVKK
jgi:hypothetical protein